MPVKTGEQTASLHLPSKGINRLSVGEADGEVKNKPSGHLCDL